MSEDWKFHGLHNKIDELSDELSIVKMKYENTLEDLIRMHKERDHYYLALQLHKDDPAVKAVLERFKRG